MASKNFLCCCSRCSAPHGTKNLESTLCCDFLYLHILGR
jgi:hypothetical protein